jgi:hypothetical protein
MSQAREEAVAMAEASQVELTMIFQEFLLSVMIFYDFLLFL